MGIFKSLCSAPAKIGLLMAVVTASASCSLKEDRDGCPCHLIIGLEQAVGNGNAGIFIFQDGDKALTDNVEPSEYPEGYYSDVRRAPATITVIQGLREGIVNEEELIIRDGYDADRLFLHNETLECGSETVRTSADLHKNWSTLEISLVTGDGTTMDNTDVGDIVSIDLSGVICGINLKTGKPIKGQFRCNARLSDSNFAVYSVNLPRQGSAGDSILISVKKGEKEVLSCDISEAISNAGFDWSKPDLDDIRLMLDYVSAEFCIEIAGWDSGTESDKVI